MKRLMANRKQKKSDPDRPDCAVHAVICTSYGNSSPGKRDGYHPAGTNDNRHTKD